MKKKLIFLIALLMMIPGTVMAATDIGFECFDEVMVGNALECKVSMLNPEKKIKGIQMNYKFDKGFSYVKTISGSEWSIASANNNGFAFLNLDGVGTSSSVAQVNFLVSNDIEVQKEYEMVLSNIMLSDGDKDIVISNKNSKVKVLSIFDVMESISINDTELELKDGVTDYKIDIPFEINDVSVNAELKDDKYSYIDGYEPKVFQNLKEGVTDLQIKVGSDNRELITFNLKLNHLQKGESTTGNIEVDNPKTGMFSFMVVFALSVIATLSVFFCKNKMKKGEQK